MLLREQLAVSIPERVWWFVEPTRPIAPQLQSDVSIPERVWWFVELGSQGNLDVV